MTRWSDPYWEYQDRKKRRTVLFDRLTIGLIGLAIAGAAAWGMSGWVETAAAASTTTDDDVRPLSP